MTSRSMKIALLGLLCAPIPGFAEIFEIADGDYVALRQAARQAAQNDEPDTILLAAGGRYAPSGQLTLDTVQGSLTIYGRGATIDGNDSDPGRLFTTGEQSNLTVVDLNIFNVNYETTDTFYAGGVMENQGMATLRNVTIANTTITASTGSVFGGAIANTGELTLRNVTLSGNRILGSGSGSALHNTGGVFLSNSTLVDNAIENGSNGGAALDASSARATTLQNTIVANNSTFNCSGSLTSSGGNLDSDDTCSLNEESDKPATDPRLSPLGEHGGRVFTHAPRDGSPAVDAGDDPFCSTVDARGVPRPRSGNANAGTACDMGAHENWTGSFGFTDAATGSWFNPDQNGHGFMFEKLPDGRLLATWFVFDPAGSRDWIQAFGEIQNGIAHMAAYQILDGAFPPQFDPDNTRLTYWGTLSVIFNGCNTGAAAWDSDTPGYGSGGMRLSRLTSVSGTSCN